MKNNIKDEMTSKERSDALMSGKPIDRLPCTCHLSEYGCRLTGISLNKYHHSSDVMAETAIEVYKTFCFDSVSVGPGLLGLPEALGSSLVFSEKERPQLLEPAIRTYDEINKLEGIKPEHEGRLPLFFKALARIKNSIGQEVKVGTGTGGAFTTAALVRGTNNFMRDLILNPESAHTLLKFTAEAVINFMKAAYNLGISYSISEPLASEDVISPAQFREFVKPYLMQICEYAKKITGKGPSLHICGHTETIWQDMADAGASFLSLDNTIDLEEAKKAIGEKAGLSGNVPPIDVLMNGTVEDVKKATKTCIKKAFDTPCGYIVSSGCTVPLDTPQANIFAMIETVRNFGKFPIDVEKLN